VLLIKRSGDFPEFFQIEESKSDFSQTEPSSLNEEPEANALSNLFTRIMASGSQGFFLVAVCFSEHFSPGSDVEQSLLLLLAPNKCQIPNFATRSPLVSPNLYN
jgi:hypothetical protein